MSWRSSLRGRGLQIGLENSLHKNLGQASSIYSSGIVEDFSDQSCSISTASNNYLGTASEASGTKEQFYTCPNAPRKTSSTKITLKRIDKEKPLSSCNLITITSSDQAGKVHQISQPQLPLDPRQWSRQDVQDWLLWMVIRNNLPANSGSIPQKFQMNGKALCLMSLQMFSFRVPVGGKLLYKDFQLRLTSAFHRELYETKF